MARIECNPECAVCGRMVAPEDREMVFGKPVHLKCSEEFQSQESNILDDPRDDEDSYGAFDN